MPRQYTPRVALACLRCGASFERAPSKVSERPFCSHACYAASKLRERVAVTCQGCGAGFIAPRYEVSRGHARFCSRPCTMRHTRQRMPITAVADRFLAKVRKTSTCWLWMGGKNAAGYGSLTEGGRGSRRIGAHRLSYQLFVGPIPRGHHVCHRCDVPSCVRPDHLFTGTPRQNTLDMFDKGRHPGSRSQGRAGTENAMALLTGEDVAEIRRRYAAGSITQEALAYEYKVSRGCVGDIVRRVNWKHVT